MKEEEGGQRRRQPPRTCASAGVTVQCPHDFSVPAWFCVSFAGDSSSTRIDDIRLFVIVAKTSSVILEVLASRSDSLVPATRHLVHLFDVQQSVDATLAQVGGKQDEGEHYSYNQHLRRRKSCDRGDEGEPEDKEDEYYLLLATFHTLGLTAISYLTIKLILGNLSEAARLLEYPSLSMNFSCLIYRGFCILHWSLYVCYPRRRRTFSIFI